MPVSAETHLVVKQSSIRFDDYDAGLRPNDYPALQTGLQHAQLSCENLLEHSVIR